MDIFKLALRNYTQTPEKSSERSLAWDRMFIVVSNYEQSWLLCNRAYDDNDKERLERGIRRMSEFANTDNLEDTLKVYGSMRIYRNVAEGEMLWGRVLEKLEEYIDNLEIAKKICLGDPEGSCYYKGAPVIGELKKISERKMLEYSE